MRSLSRTLAGVTGLRSALLGAIALLALLVAGMILAIVLTSPPARAGCETVGCAEECYWVGPGHRRCHRRCRIRCWNDAPRYYAPQPQYYPIAAVAPDIDPLLIMGALIIALGAILFGLISHLTGSSSTSQEIAEVDSDTAKTHDLARRYEDLERETQEHISKVLSKARGEHHE